MAEPALYRMRWPTRERPSLGEREIAGRHDLPSTTYRNSDGDSGRGDTGRNPTAGTFLNHPGLNPFARRLGFAKIIDYELFRLSQGGQGRRVDSAYYQGTTPPQFLWGIKCRRLSATTLL